MKKSNSTIINETAISASRSVIFISHSSTDRSIATAAYEKLKQIGLNPWIDKNDIPHDETWIKVIGEALDRTHLMVLVLSPSIGNSPWVPDEVARAKRKGLPFIIWPVKAGWESIADNWIIERYPPLDTANDMPEAQVAKLVQAIRSKLPSVLITCHDSKIEVAENIKNALDGVFPKLAMTSFKRLDVSDAEAVVTRHGVQCRAVVVLLSTTKDSWNGCYRIICASLKAGLRVVPISIEPLSLLHRMELTRLRLVTHEIYNGDFDRYLQAITASVYGRSEQGYFLLKFIKNLTFRHWPKLLITIFICVLVLGVWPFQGKHVRDDTVPKLNSKLTSSLLEAVASGSLDQVEALMQRGADFNGQGPKGETPVMLAAQKGDQEIMDALLAKHPDLKIRDQQGRTALMYAVAGKHGRLTEILLKSGADPNVPDGQGITAVMRDLSHNYCPSLEPLIRFSADVNAVDRDGRTALMRAVMAQREDSCIKYLLATKKIDLGIKDHSGKMALDYAVEAANRPAIGEILEHLAESDCNSAQGLNALAVAVKLGNEYWVERLLDQGAPVNGRTSIGLSPLMIACANSFTDPRMINLLLRKGAEKDAKTDDGRTALMIALDHGESGRGAAQVLLNRGADVRVRDSNGKTALDYARDKNLDDLIRLIELRLKAG